MATAINQRPACFEARFPFFSVVRKPFKRVHIYVETRGLEPRTFRIKTGRDNQFRYVSVKPGNYNHLESYFLPGLVCSTILKAVEQVNAFFLCVARAGFEPTTCGHKYQRKSEGSSLHVFYASP